MRLIDLMSLEGAGLYFYCERLNHEKNAGKPEHTQTRNLGVYPRNIEIMLVQALIWPQPCNTARKPWRPAVTSTFDPTRKFIRIVTTRSDGMVEFEFAVGEPELFVEMLLPQAAFEDFCAAQGVRPDRSALPADADADADPTLRRDFDWTLHDAMAWSSRHRL